MVVGTDSVLTVPNQDKIKNILTLSVTLVARDFE